MWLIKEIEEETKTERGGEGEGVGEGREGDKGKEIMREEERERKVTNIRLIGTG